MGLGEAAADVEVGGEVAGGEVGTEAGGEAGWEEELGLPSAMASIAARETDSTEICTSRTGDKCSPGRLGPPATCAATWLLCLFEHESH